MSWNWRFYVLSTPQASFVTGAKMSLLVECKGILLGV